MSAVAFPNVPNVPNEQLWRLSVDQYHAMIRNGILTEDDPVELLSGCLVTKMPKHPRHTVVTQLIRDAIAALLPAGWFVHAQEPVTTSDSEPEPDVTVVRGERRDYLDRHPGPDDIGLVIEVAGTSLQRDQTTKKRLYATAGIIEYWVVDLEKRNIEVYREPADARYGREHFYESKDNVPLQLDGRPIGFLEVANLLP